MSFLNKKIFLRVGALAVFIDFTFYEVGLRKILRKKLI